MKSIGMRLVRSTSLVLFLVLATGIAWSFYTHRQQANNELLEQSRVIAAQVMALRQVAAENQHKINYDSFGNFEFKHLNPASFVHKVAGVFNSTTNYRIRQVSLQPRLPDNTPDAFERQHLLSFTGPEKLKEAWGIGKIDGEEYFRYLVPLYTESSCLQCHGTQGEVDIAGYKKEGYTVGDLAGALSIAVPMEAKITSINQVIANNILMTAVAIIFSAVMIIFHTNLFVSAPISGLVRFSKQLAAGKLDARPDDFPAYGEVEELLKQFSAMARELQEIYDQLELKVADRTKELAEVNQELEKLSQYKSEFLANMSHELRTPLTAILAFSQQLLVDESGNLSKNQKEYLHDIQDSGHSLLNLINELLDLAKIESGHMFLNLTEVAVGDIATEVVKLFHPIATGKNIQVVTNIDHSTEIIADASKVRQVVQNLLGNALKFSPEGSTVTVKVTTATTPAEGIIIEVQDAGPGIAPQEQELIFGAFYQAHRGLNKEFKGTGLGLALVRKIVELHLGQIELSSPAGEGATFKVFLPAYPPFDKDLD